MLDIGIPELLAIGVFGVLAGGVALGLGWMLFGRRRTRQ
jgi:hypothetical protein